MNIWQEKASLSIEKNSRLQVTKTILSQLRPKALQAVLQVGMSKPTKESSWDLSSPGFRNWTIVIRLLYCSVFIYFIPSLCRLAIWPRVHHFYVHLNHIQKVINSLNLISKFPETKSECSNSCIQPWFYQVVDSKLRRNRCRNLGSGREKRKKKVMNCRSTQIIFLIFKNVYLLTLLFYINLYCRFFNIDIIINK